MTKQPFNSSLEIALRALFLLAASAPTNQSVQKLIYFDYLTIHSNDVEGGPSSMHPPVPHRTGEWLMRRDTLEKSLGLLIQRELASVVFDESGIYFSATELTHAFVEYFQSDYAELLKERTAWVIDKFGSLTDEELAKFMNSHIAVWGQGETNRRRRTVFE